MTNPAETSTPIESARTARMRELAVRYAQAAEDLDNPAPHWDMIRERRILRGYRDELDVAADAFRRERTGSDAEPRTEAKIDALCAAARAYFVERREYISGRAARDQRGNSDYSACAAAWAAVEEAALA